MTTVGRLQVRAVPGAHRTELVGRYGDAWKIRVAAAPERGRANAELQRFLADLVGVARTAVMIDAGAGGRDKLVRVEGVDSDTIARLITAAAGK